MHPAHIKNRLEYPKPRNSANSLRNPNSNSSHSSKNERKEQYVSKSSITKNSLSTVNPNKISVMRNNIQRTSTENNPFSSNARKYSREVDHSSRSSTIYNSKSFENNLRFTNSKKHSTEVESSGSSTIYNPKRSENNLRLTNSKNLSTEAESSRFSTTQNSNNMGNDLRSVKRITGVVNDSRSINSKMRSLKIGNSDGAGSGLSIIKKRPTETGNSKIISTTHGPMQRNSNKVGNLSRGMAINNLNRVENNSRLANPRKRSIEVENNPSPANPQKRVRIENQNNSSTIHNRIQGGSNMKNNIRAATNRTTVVNSSSNLVQRNNSTGNYSHHSRKPVNSLLPVGFDRFSTQALSKKTKNKELSKDEWENIRLIKAALINLVASSQKYNRIEAGKFAWAKINEWVYDTFYPDLNKYLDEKSINRENADLVVKAILDYYVSRNDRYRRRIRKKE